MDQPRFAGMYHPWRALRRMSHVRLRWEKLPEGMLGMTDFDTNEVILDPEQNVTQADRRSTLTHELHHLLRGPVPTLMRHREEVTCDRLAARLLLPDIKAIGDALAWADRNIAEAAAELWVDEDMLKVRLEHLHPSERGYLKRRLAEPGE